MHHHAEYRSSGYFGWSFYLKFEPQVIRAYNSTDPQPVTLAGPGSGAIGECRSFPFDFCFDFGTKIHTLYLPGLIKTAPENGPAQSTKDARNSTPDSGDTLQA